MKSQFKSVLIILLLLDLTFPFGRAAEKQVHARFTKEETRPFAIIRLGPRFSELEGSIVSGGNRSVQFDLSDDLKLDGLNIGPQLELEITPFNRWHLDLGYVANEFDAQATVKDITSYSGIFARISDPATLLAGSSITSKLNFEFIHASLQYDLLQYAQLTLAPFIGAKYVTIDETTVIQIPLLPSLRHETSVDVATPYFGLDATIHLSSRWDLTLRPQGFVTGRFAYYGGRGFLSYKFHPRTAVRGGVDFEHVDYPSRSNGFGTETTLKSVFLDITIGF